MRDVRTVRALQDDLADEAVDVLLINVQDEIGAELTERYYFRVTPTYIIFDANAQEVWHGHNVPSKEEILAHIN